MDIIEYINNFIIGTGLVLVLLFVLFLAFSYDD